MPRHPPLMNEMMDNRVRIDPSISSWLNLEDFGKLSRTDTSGFEVSGMLEVIYFPARAGNKIPMGMPSLLLIYPMILNFKQPETNGFFSWAFPRWNLQWPVSKLSWMF